MEKQSNGGKSSKRRSETRGWDGTGRYEYGYMNESLEERYRGGAEP